MQDIQVTPVRRIARTLAAKALIMAVVAFAVAAPVACLVTAASVSAAEKEKAPENSRKVIKPLKAASEAYEKQDYETALKRLDEADAIDSKNAYDQFKIDQFRAYVFLGQKTNYPQVLALFEKLWAVPEYLQPQEAEMLPKQMTLLAFQTQQFPKVQQYGEIWMQAHPDDTNILDVMARASYLAKDFQKTHALLDRAISLAETAGTPPQEIWMQLQASCGSEEDNEQWVNAAYETMVRYYPKTEHWRKLLERTVYAERNEDALLNLYRLMFETATLNRAEQFSEYAQLALNKAMPGESLKVWKAGVDDEIVGGPKDKEKDRNLTLYAEAKQKAQADRAQLPDIEKEAANPKYKTGQMSVALGLAYFSFDMYPEAVKALKAGLDKGGVKNADDANMALGIAYLRAGDKEAARTQFQSIPATSPSIKAAHLWAIRTYN